MRCLSLRSSSVRTAWISRLSLSAGARLRFCDLAPAEVLLLAREGLTAVPKEAAAEVLPSGNSRLGMALRRGSAAPAAALLGRNGLEEAGRTRDRGPARTVRPPRPGAPDVGEPAAVRARSPEREVAGTAEGLAGRRLVAAGEDLAQTLGAVLSHPLNIGRKGAAPEHFLDPIGILEKRDRTRALAPAAHTGIGLTQGATEERKSYVRTRRGDRSR